jgi:serine/threonine protein kinase
MSHLSAIAIKGRPVRMYPMSAAKKTNMENQWVTSTSGFEMPSAASSSRSLVGSSIDRFRLCEEVGRGAMGIVFRGEDLQSGATVAVKVLENRGGGGPAFARAVKRFEKEARLLCAVRNEFVTQLIEFGSHEDCHYLVMEFVDGINLKQYLSERGPLSEEVALELIRDCVKGLAVAHHAGIVHRDFKPENVMLSGHHASQNVQWPCRVKLSDFGIARSIDQSESLDLTQAGSLLGTPIYMSPEQCRADNNLTPATDVYAVGITLFEMLTGQPPFIADDPLKLVGQHCFSAAPTVSSLRPDISDPTNRLIGRMLAKRPGDRFADAAQLLIAIEEILRGNANQVEPHPLTPARDDRYCVEKTFTWDLLSSPDLLWPLVSNTERLNRAIGLPAVVYTTHIDELGNVRRFGECGLSFTTLKWEEHPFEWIEGRRMGVLREFQRQSFFSPFRWFLSRVELEPLPNGGTRLQHSIRIQAHGFVGRKLAQIELQWKAGKSLGRVYRRMDESLLATKSLAISPGDSRPLPIDPFEPTSSLASARKHRLQSRHELLLAEGIPLETAERLIEYLETAAIQDVSNIRPLAIASILGLDGKTLVDACLSAAHVGLLQLSWELLCPTCRVAASSANILSEINSHTHCDACNIDFQTDVADAIELVFRIHPEIREPETGTYCIGGPVHSPHVAAQLRLLPGETVRLDLQLEPGLYVLRGPQLTSASPLHVHHELGATSCRIQLSSVDGDMDSLTLRAGSQMIHLTNSLAVSHLVRIERAQQRHDRISAARALTIPKFRKYFPEHSFQKDCQVTAQNLTVLSCCLNTESGAWSTDRTAASPDNESTIRQVRDWFELCTQACSSHHGTFAQLDGEGLLAVFPEVANAFAAAVQIVSLHAHGTRQYSDVSIGIDRGSVVMTTLLDRVHYLGPAVRNASTLRRCATPGIHTTIELAQDLAVAPILQSRNNPFEIERTDNTIHFRLRNGILS